MERPVRANFNAQIYEEACEWFIECRAGDLDDAARAEFDRWLRKSPEHQSAYLEIAAIWNEGPTLDPANRWDLNTLIAQAAEDPDNVVALDRTPRSTSNAPATIPPRRLEGEGKETPETSPQVLTGSEEGRADALEQANSYASKPVARSGRVRLFAAAASILLVTAALATYLLMPSGVYATVLGEQRSLALSDGSTVQLNSLSKIRIRYSEHERTVDLVQGQALFHVAKDTARPFVVYSLSTRVRAVGTQFDVYRKSGETIVTVVEGRVAVIPMSLSALEERESPAAREGEASSDSGAKTGERPQTATPHTVSPPGERDGPAQREGAGQSNPGPGTRLPKGTIFLAAGEQITVTPRAARRTPHPNLAGATAWTQRQLVFDSASLTEVAEEFNRYNERKLVIDPSALGSLHVSGVFSSTDPASIIRFLRDRPGLRVTETSTESRVEKDL
jgi:transmembrane sensor